MPAADYAFSYKSSYYIKYIYDIFCKFYLTAGESWFKLTSILLKRFSRLYGNQGMKKRTTVKDIARIAGVSLGSVHCALSGKPGVGDATRERILRIAEEQGYRPNAIAASLKRKNLKVAAVIPELTGENRFYYQPILEGITDYVHTLQDYNVELVIASYSDDEADSQASEIKSLSDRNDISGIVSVGYTPTKGIIPIAKSEGKEIPMVLVGNDLPESGRLCSVLPDYRMVGRTMAEQMLINIPSGSPILICAGSSKIPSNYLIVEGIELFLQETKFEGRVHKLYSSDNGEVVAGEVEKLLKEEQIGGCCSVTARTSASLGSILEQYAGNNRLYSIGVDLFEETMDFLRRGVFVNLVQNNPYKSAYLATKILTEFLLKDLKPAMEVMHIGSEIVFRSNLPMYENGYYRLLM